MSGVSTIKCDVCGRQKAEVNHWLVAVVPTENRGLLFAAAEEVEGEEHMPEFQYEDICGQACAQRRLQIWLDSWMAPQPDLGDRASSLELKPPLARDGRAPAAGA